MKKSVLLGCIIFCLTNSMQAEVWNIKETLTSPVVYSFYSYRSWNLTWTYYYVNEYILGETHYNSDQYNSEWLENGQCLIDRVVLNQCYGIYRGTWEWTCFYLLCFNDTGTTRCNDEICGGPATTLSSSRELNCSEYPGCFVPVTQTNLEKPQHTDSNNSISYYFPSNLTHLFSPGNLGDTPTIPNGNGNGPLFITHTH